MLFYDLEINGLPVDFVESDDEGRFLGFEKIERFDRLRFQPVHNVHDEDGDIAQRRTSGTQIAERFVAGSVDNEKTGHFQLHLLESVDHFRLLSDGIDGHVSGTDLLGNAAGFAVLDVRSTQFIQNLGFARVDVTQYADDRSAQDVGILFLFVRPFPLLSNKFIL